MKYILAVILVSFTNMICASEQKLSKKEIGKYFEEICLNSEYGKGSHKVTKWESDIKVFKEGDWSNVLNEELDKIINELKELTNLNISIVDKKEDANYCFFIGDISDYITLYNLNLSTKFNGNFVCYYNGNVISKNVACVNITNVKTEQAQKHVLREEFTQSLGLINDSRRSKYKDSVFYDKINNVTEYSEIDKAIIKLLYNPNIKAGMTKQEVLKAIKDFDILKDY